MAQQDNTAGLEGEDELVSLPHYPWPPLLSENHRRLVYLHPAPDEEDTIIVSLSQHSLDDLPEYNALSYHWGHPARVRDVLVLPHEDDQDENSELYRITIHQNLFLALKRIRHRERVRCMWTDFLCINQDDAQEKGRQVQRMTSVYKDSAGVLVYLGEEDATDGSQHIAAIFDAIQEASAEVLNTGTFANPEDLQAHGARRMIELACSKLSAISKSSDPELLTQMAITFIKNFFCREWFHRVWVVQEISPAIDDTSKALCILGSQELHWPHVLWARVLMTRLEYGTRIDPDFNHTAPALHYALEKTTKLIGLLEKSQQLQAVDPRDHCFGMLGVSDHAMNPDLQPDYQEAVTETFLRFSKILIGEGSGPGILLLCTKLEEHCWGLPSWAPDWSRRPRWSLPIFDDRSYHAGSQNEGTCRLVTDRILSASGFVFSGIVATAMAENPHLALKWAPWREPIEALDNHMNSQLCLLLGTWTMLNAALKSAARRDVLPAGKLDFQVLCRYLLNDYLWSGDRMTSEMPWVPKFFEALWTWDTDVLVESLKDLEVQQSVAAMVGRTADVDVCVTRTGHLAKLPSMTKHGCVIALVVGCRLPLVLQPVSDRGDEMETLGLSGKKVFEVVGHAYVHGIMDGEAIAENEDKIEELILV